MNKPFPLDPYPGGHPAPPLPEEYEEWEDE